MKSFLSKIVAFLILAICTVGFSSTIVPAFAHEPSGGYGAGYERGYQHGYQDAVSGRGLRKCSLNPTALKITAPPVQLCTKVSMPAMMPAFALDLATKSTVITAFGLS
jgi:hypothetical protein